ncbi:hypothetical protein NBO_128g0002 [Nosema bombycis CQ1]|uniref:Uncharacterized protein n=1 Tax=Nosema bombycis (strain CQ1 / CVCC 102059) TaxID=578461 RepID=R0MGB9_NOSB1|nr:hypothetical protein NBO_128g0002 [Nosema bombycis CQ1]|eukprot:EOB13190.1 hypothetical protein NBO_128g0002 [Nosema bombycis CQ1]
MIFEFTYLELHDFIEGITTVDIEKILNFDKSYLYYFKDCHECLENLQNFVNVLYEHNHFKLCEKEINICRFFMKSKKAEIPMSIYTFIECFKKMFVGQCYEQKLIKNFPFNLFDRTRCGNIINKCINHVTGYLKNNENLNLSLTNRYYSFYYMRNYCKIVYEALEEKNLLLCLVTKNGIETLDLPKIYKCIDDKLLNIEKQIEKNSLDEENMRNFFSQTFGELILDDYFIIEKIVCDYLNMFKYIINLSRNIEEPSRKSSEVIRLINNDDIDYKITRSIRITLNENSVFLHIKALSADGQEIPFYKDVDYFVNEFGYLYITMEALNVKNVKSVELILLVTQFNKNFKVYSFFDVNEDGLKLQ